MQKSSFTINVVKHIRWDTEVQKAVHESLPYYVKGFIQAHFEDSTIKIDYLESNVSVSTSIDAVNDLIVRTSSNFRDVKDEVLWQSDGQPVVVGSDPFHDFVNSGDIVSTGLGKYVYKGDFLIAFEALDAFILDYCLKMGASKERYPSTVKTETLISSGYLKHTPQLAFFVAPAHLSQICLQKIGDPEFLNQGDLTDVTGLLGLPEQILSPTVCYHCFEANQNKSLRVGSVTALSLCHRHEPVNVTGLERLTTYWMRELIEFNDAKACQVKLDNVLEWTSEFLKCWGVWHTINTAYDPFFSDFGASNRLFQVALNLKREIRLPVMNNKTIAIASFNNHQRTLVKKFGISSTGGSLDNLNSACVGWGYDRLLYGLFCQFGSELSKWPVTVKRDLKI